MVETTNAIYENGILRPLSELHISEGMKVKLIIESDEDSSVDDILNLATTVFEGLSEKEISNIEKILEKAKTYLTKHKILVFCKLKFPEFAKLFPHDGWGIFITAIFLKHLLPDTAEPLSLSAHTYPVLNIP